jgi:hypothetical protein
MKGSGCVLTGFNKPNLSERRDDVAKQVDDLLILRVVHQQAKFAAQALESRRPFFQQTHHVRARRSQQMGLPSVGDIDDAFVVPASFQISARTAQAKGLQSVVAPYARASTQASVLRDRGHVGWQARTDAFLQATRLNRQL